MSATLHYIGTPLQTHAASAKAGVDALSAQMCIEYGPWGVTSNVRSCSNEDGNFRSCH